MSTPASTEATTLAEEPCPPTAGQSVNALLWETRMMLDFLEGDLHARAQLAVGFALTIDKQTEIEFILPRSLTQRMSNERRVELLESSTSRSC
jgi:hypothetical protein